MLLQVRGVHMKKIKRKVKLILCLILIVILGGFLYNHYLGGIIIPWGHVFHKRQVREIAVPGQHIDLYLKAAEKHNVPWEYLAAIDEVVSKYSDTKPETIEKNAQKLLGAGQNTNQMLLKEYGKDKSDQITDIAEDYQWEAAPIKEPYLFPFKREDRNKVGYSNDWGGPRSYGGKRKHEGIDLMSPKGTPLISVTDCIVLKKGWNQLGGWRLYLQDKKYPHIFYYYAHLNNYAENIESGTAVTKGQLLGFVGDSGYGPTGTTGKFPPHLHFGIYIMSGVKFQAVNPFAFLKAWDRGVQ